MTDRNAAFTATVPAAYDSALGPMFFEPYAVDLATRVQMPPGTAILEVAAGTGRATAHLLAHLPADGRLTATDLNEGMLEIAKRKVASDPRLEWKAADAMALPFADSSFDTVVSQFGLMFVPDKVQALREFRRTLKPGGRLVFSVWGSLEENPGGRIAHETLEQFFPADPPRFYCVPFGMYDTAQVTAMLEEAGFSSSSMAIVDFIAESASAELAAHGLIFGSPVLLAVEERGGVEPEAIARAIAVRLEREGGRAPMRLPMRARVFTSIK